MIKELDDAYLDAAKENRQFSGLVNFCNFKKITIQSTKLQLKGKPDVLQSSWRYLKLNSAKMSKVKELS